MFPAVVLLGPRQCGKTTLAKQIGATYFDMEREGDKVRLDAQWEQLSSSRKLVIIDEAQQSPQVFSRLRSTIDQDRKRNGRFLLLGSVAPSLMKGVSQSLAGRMGIVKMSPLILPELKAGQIDDLWLYGGYPDGGILDKGNFPFWQQDYLEAMTSRDLPNWGLAAKPRQTMRLLNMLAAVNGQLLNSSQLGNSLSLDQKTVLRYSDFLEGAYLIRRLQPYSANIKKRLVKSQRIFWRDSGLLHALLNVTSMEQLYNHPQVGFSWESFVIEQTLTTLDGLAVPVQPFFFRTSDGYELDLVLDWGTSKWAIEIKLTTNPTPGIIKRLKKTADMIGADKHILICRAARKIENDKLLVISPTSWVRRLGKTEALPT